MTLFRKTILILTLFLASCTTRSDERDAGQIDTGLQDALQTGAADQDSDMWSEPKDHRVTPVVCALRDRVVGTSDMCNDEDCTMGDNGRCRIQDGPELTPEFCTYDACNEDTDCDTNEVCECGNLKDLFIIGPGADENRCVPSNCRIDQDCGAAFCKPSPDICGSGKVFAYFCTTQADECLENSDCGNGICAYNADQTRWICDGCN